MIRLGLGLGMDTCGSLRDSDVASFVSRASLTNSTQINAISGLVGSLKSNALWSKMIAIYPFVGGTAGSHAVNLVSSSFPITWAGTITHSSNGVQGNGTTGMGDLATTPSAMGLQLNSTHFSAYINQAETVFGCQMGACDAGVQCLQMGINLGPGTAFWDCYGVTTGRVTGTANASTTGFFLGSRSASNANALYRNGTSYLSNATASETLNNTLSIYLLCRNLSGATTLFSDARYALMSFGTGLTSGEVTAFNTAVQAFETALGRA